MHTHLRAGLSAMGLVVALVRLDRPAVRSLGDPLACDRAQVIDGELRCDAELLADVRDLCGGPSSQPLGPGDELRHACTWGVVARMPPEQLAALEQPVDLNGASLDELASLPGIGPTIAARIVAGRPYASIDELLDVDGIGPKRFVAIRPRARLGPSTGR
jgi:DNA uptake protein ComE-like DNA-binding protein